MKLIIRSLLGSTKVSYKADNVDRPAELQFEAEIEEELTSCLCESFKTSLLESV